MEIKNTQETDDYHYLDPKLLKVTEMPRNRAAFQDAIVFVVGGGNYIEYQNLVDYAKVLPTLELGAARGLVKIFTGIFLQQKTSAGNTKRIIYGSSTLNNAKQFLKQLSLLGQEIH